MALTNRTSLGPVRRLAMVLTMGMLAGLGSVAIAPAASADDDEKSVAVSVELEDDEDSKDDDGDDDRDGPISVVHKSGGKGPDAFIIMERGRRAVFFCDAKHEKKRHNVCTVPVTNPTRF